MNRPGMVDRGAVLAWGALAVFVAGMLLEWRGALAVELIALGVVALLCHELGRGRWDVRGALVVFAVVLLAVIGFKLFFASIMGGSLSGWVRGRLIAAALAQWVALMLAWGSLSLLYRAESSAWFELSRGERVGGAPASGVRRAMLLALVLALALGGRAASDAWARAERDKARAELIESTAAPGGSCACDEGKRCTGPSGGRYCLTDGGSKRYFKRED